MPSTPIARAKSHPAIEPVGACTCNCEDFPPINAFALPPMPFSKFLERENIINRFQQAPLSARLAYGHATSKTGVLGSLIDVRG
ncbi:MAG: hypothetical protein H7210_03305 [Pyrinomonadaceae bacterium]|nr:hypothetical protein [Phycisphaerales bacterium]